MYQLSCPWLNLCEPDVKRAPYRSSHSSHFSSVSARPNGVDAQNGKDDRQQDSLNDFGNELRVRLETPPHHDDRVTGHCAGQAPSPDPLQSCIGTSFLGHLRTHG